MGTVKKNAIVGLLGAFLLAGCASIVSKSNWPVNLTSTPSDCQVTVKDEKGVVVFRGTTPTIITLSASSGFFSGANYQVTFEKEGYQPVTVPLSSELNPWYIGNIFFGGLIGFLIVDPATGAMYKLPEQVHGTLNKQQQSSGRGEPKLWIGTIDQVPQELRSHLERIR